MKEKRQLQISCHCFWVFFLLLFLHQSLREMARDSLKFLVTFLFLFLFLFFFILTLLLPLLYLYYAQDSSKKWQEILNKLGLHFPRWGSFKFSGHYFFSLFISSTWYLFRKLARGTAVNFLVTIFFVFFFFFLHLIFTTRRIV